MSVPLRSTTVHRTRAFLSENWTRPLADHLEDLQFPIRQPADRGAFSGVFLAPIGFSPRAGRATLPRADPDSLDSGALGGLRDFLSVFSLGNEGPRPTGQFAGVVKENSPAEVWCPAVRLQNSGDRIMTATAINYRSTSHDWRLPVGDFRHTAGDCRRTAGDFRLEVQRGPNWLLARVQPGADEGPDWSALADRLRSLLDRHFTYRLMLDLGEIERFGSGLLNQLIVLDRWVQDRGGMMRLCGLSSEGAALFHVCGLDRVFSVYRGRLDGAWTFGRLDARGFPTTR